MFKRSMINIIKLAILPATAYLAFLLLCKLNGIDGFGKGTDMIIILRNTFYTGLIALAVSFNLTSGRIDFSVGATLLISTTIGAMLTLRFGLGPVSLLLLSLFAGAVFGGLHGALYSALRLPPMIVSLGVAMIYEAFVFKLTGGRGVSLLGFDNLLIWSKQPYITIFIAVVLVVLYFLLNKTVFGLNTQSLQKGQEIAVQVGINEKRNAIACYIIAGICLAGAGTVNISVLGNVVPQLSLASISYIANAFLPMFIGTVLARYFDRNLGVIIGSLTQAIIFVGIGKLGISTSWQIAINGAITIAFFAYSYNAYRIVEFRMFKEKRQQALASRRFG